MAKALPAGRPYGEILARNMRAARGRAGIGQEDVAGRMRALGFGAWVRQTVSKSERGARRMLVEEVYALAWVLETSMAALLQPTKDDGTVAFPSGNVVGGATVVASVHGTNDGTIVWKDNEPQWIAVSYPSSQRPPGVDEWMSGGD
jgi:hypothetical protein